MCLEMTILERRKLLGLVARYMNDWEDPRLPQIIRRTPLPSQQTTSAVPFKTEVQTATLSSPDSGPVQVDLLPAVPVGFKLRSITEPGY